MKKIEITPVAIADIKPRSHQPSSHVIQLRGSHQGPRFETLPPLSLYVHIPWCIKKCPYCDFNSHQEPNEGLPEARYLRALEADIEASLPLIWGRSIQTVFIGGGTPSLFSPEAIDQLLASIRARLKLAPGAEITLEANPGTFEQNRFQGFKDAGITRLSIGIQSFQERFLKALGRVHNGAEARKAVEIGVNLFERVNLDIMYALPEQTIADALQDVAIALTYGISHLSFYHLTLEPNTYFHRYPPPLPDEDEASHMQENIEEKLLQAGFNHYEVSAFAKTKQESRHNLNYWQFGDYLGIGAGAHGKISFADKVIRQHRYRQPEQYMQSALKGNSIQGEQVVGASDIGFEFMLNALRLREGVPAILYEMHTGFPLSNLSPILNIAVQRGWLEPDPTILRPTPLGFRFLNDLLELFLPSVE
ncbi:MAG: radical SAM family heme chaperone HemW [Pseudomonadota bacterium]